MATTYTTNYNLGKQENHADKFDMDVITDNADKIDAALTGLQSGIDGKQDALSSEQLAAVNSGITEEDVTQIGVNKNNILFTATIGKCESTGNTANKVVTVSDVNYTPHKGSIIAVKFKYGNSVTDTAEHPITLNVNNTGAYRIWYKNGDYANASQGKVFGLSGYYIYYMYDGVDRWVWINYCMDNTYSLMSQAEASAGIATNERLISAKVLSDTIDEKLVPVENNILSLYKSGSANILKNTAQTQALGGVTFTMNPDGSITANGTKNNNDWLYLSTGNSLKAGTYVLSSGGIIGDDKLVIITTGESLGTAIMSTNTATGVYERELTQDYNNLYYAIRIANGTVCNNIIFKPMLCEKSVYEAINGEFQPYAMSNAEITAWILAHS